MHVVARTRRRELGETEPALISGIAARAVRERERLEQPADEQRCWIEREPSRAAPPAGVAPTVGRRTPALDRTAARPRAVACALLGLRVGSKTRAACAARRCG